MHYGPPSHDIVGHGIIYKAEGVFSEIGEIHIYYDYDKFSPDAKAKYAGTEEKYPFVYRVYGAGAGVDTGKDMVTAGMKFMSNAKKFGELMPTATVGYISVQQNHGYKNFDPDILEGSNDGVAFTLVGIHYSNSKYKDGEVQTHEASFNLSPVDIDGGAVYMELQPKTKTDEQFKMKEEMESEWWYNFN